MSLERFREDCIARNILSINNLLDSNRHLPVNEAVDWLFDSFQYGNLDIAKRVMSIFKWQNIPIELFMSICQNKYSTFKEITELLDWIHQQCARMPDSYFIRGLNCACRDANINVLRYITKDFVGLRCFDKIFASAACGSGHCAVAQYFLDNQLCNKSVDIFNQGLEETCYNSKLFEKPSITMIRWLLYKGANNYDKLQNDARIGIQQLWYDGYVPLNAIESIRPEAIKIHDQIRTETSVVLNVVDLANIVLNYLFRY